VLKMARWALCCTTCEFEMRRGLSEMGGGGGGGRSN
jgi:hypothetical protein